MELFVKGTFVAKNIKRDAVKAAVRPYEACNCANLGARQQADPRQQQAGRADVRPQQEGRLRECQPRGGGAGHDPLAIGAGAVRDMVIDAWKMSGELKVGAPVVSMRDILSGKHILRRYDFHYD